MAKTRSKIGTNPLDYLSQDAPRALDLAVATLPREHPLEVRCRELAADRDALRGELSLRESALEEERREREGLERRLGDEARTHAATLAQAREAARAEIQSRDAQIEGAKTRHAVELHEASLTGALAACSITALLACLVTALLF